MRGGDEHELRPLTVPVADPYLFTDGQSERGSIPANVATGVPLMLAEDSTGVNRECSGSGICGR